jgi:RPA family protein
MNRQPTRRAFAAEVTDATFEFREADDPTAPTFILLPTGARANRLLIAGTLVSTDSHGPGAFRRGRIVDPSGESIFAVAGETSKPALEALKSLEPPEIVLAIGKTDTYLPAGADERRVSLQADTITPIDEARRDDWVVDAAIQTHNRITAYDTVTNPYAAVASAKYPATEPAAYWDDALTALETIDRPVATDTAPVAGVDSAAPTAPTPS